MEQASTEERIEEAAAIRRIQFLRAEIARHDDLYYRQAAPEISDAEYDALKRELRELERLYPELLAAEESQRREIGDDRSGDFLTARHGQPMLSLEKAYDEAELEAFFAGLSEQVKGDDATLLMEPKIDGMAICLVYENGRFVRAVTRGNGAEGDVITENARRISGIPDALTLREGERAPELIELRGEIYVSLEDFRMINDARLAAGEEPYAHPRNYAAASAKLSDAEMVAERNLSVVVFGYGDIQPESWEPDSLRGFYDSVRDWGLPVVSYRELRASWETIKEAAREANLLEWGRAYPIDGFVFKLDERNVRERVGWGKDAPKWAIAYKPVSERVESVVTEIKIQVSRTGQLSPVALLQPIELGGSEIARATLHNEAWIRDRDIRAGDRVLVERVGEVIPAIVGVDRDRRATSSVPYAFPQNCPECGEETRKDGGEAYCENRHCPAIVRGRIEHFASSKAMGIRGLGPATIERWVDAGLAQSLADLYRIDAERLKAITAPVGVRERRILEQIELSKEKAFWRVLVGLGLPGIGPVRAKELSRVAEDLDSLGALAADLQDRENRLEALGWGETTVSDLLVYLRLDWVRSEIEELDRLGVGQERSDGF